ncbi:antibiotic biosynthesis monooxygenase [Phytoactinopolyspora alkaliphila]|uniref:Antibiotic biosynthesis monooxygenase n=1 Tax=Phytoactinopolyspora alkaliphila TaxID=1783498 RepID=A0A6N9YTV4_9ACTN|nr:antibiotic biosynthesis monooxygenase family protein [Phytoactinopolyspora alkaliphila]NED98405.1 antibiotic biosynthesis monooxygenase [Phytoactinopolyspora alkaliphila]
MLVVTRYRVPREEAPDFRDQAREALLALSGQRGWENGHVGRSTDDPTLWVITSQWRDVGSYRRALSSYDVKLRAVPLLSRAIDEPTAFEILTTADAGARAADADDVALGDAAAPVVLTDLDASSRAQVENVHPREGGMR